MRLIGPYSNPVVHEEIRRLQGSSWPRNVARIGRPRGGRHPVGSRFGVSFARAGPARDAGMLSGADRAPCRRREEHGDVEVMTDHSGGKFNQQLLDRCRNIGTKEEVR